MAAALFTVTILWMVEWSTLVSKVVPSVLVSLRYQVISRLLLMVRLMTWALRSSELKGTRRS